MPPRRRVPGEELALPEKQISGRFCPQRQQARGIPDDAQASHEPACGGGEPRGDLAPGHIDGPDGGGPVFRRFFQGKVEEIAAGHAGAGGRARLEFPQLLAIGRVDARQDCLPTMSTRSAITPAR